MNIRSWLSLKVNKLLARFGYAFVRVDGGRNPTDETVHQGLRFAYETILVVDAYAPWALDENFLFVYNKVARHTLVDIYRGYELFDLVREVAQRPGDILEVGVWRGGTGALLASAASKWKPEARVWLCDTFSGVVKASSLDSEYLGGEHADTNQDIVRKLMISLEIKNVSLLKGIFPDQTGDIIDSRAFSFCHIDVDSYQSALDIMNWLESRIVPGGIVVFDDYGFKSCKGITRLVREQRETGQWIFVNNLNKHAMLIRRPLA